jgi:hypothetical protein
MTNNALNHLRKLALEDEQRKHPNVPEYALPKPKYSDKTSNGLTKCIIDFLKLSGWQAERIAVTGRMIDDRHSYTDVIGNTKTIGSTRWIKSSMQVGTADISATVKGRSVKIEVKVGRDRQRPKQIEYQKQVEAAGGIYLLVKSFDQFYSWYVKNVGRL